MNMMFTARLALSLALLSHVGLSSANSALILCTHEDGQAFIEWANFPCCWCEHENSQPSDKSSGPEIESCCCNCVDTALVASHVRVDSHQKNHFVDTLVQSPVVSAWFTVPQPEFQPAPAISISPHLQVVLASHSTVVLTV